MCKIKNILAACIGLIFIATTPAFADVNNDLVTKVSFGRSADVDILLKQKADPNTVNGAGLPVIFLAAGRDDDEAPKIISLLIKAGADIYAADPRGNMPIIEAVRSGNPESVKVLIENKAIMSVKDTRGNDLMKIAQNRGDKKVIAYVKAGMDAERKQLGDLQSGDNLTKLMQKYSFDSCANYYIRYYKRDNPDKMSDEKFNKIIAKNEAARQETSGRLIALFDIEQKDINYMDKETKRAIVEKLDSMLTNENRLYNNFGENDDLNAKCKRIAQTWDGNRFSYVEGKHGKRIITEYK